MRKTKIRKIGNSYGVILPKETLDQMQVARHIMKKRRKALRELSK